MDLWGESPSKPIHVLLRDEQERILGMNHGEKLQLDTLLQDPEILQETMSGNEQLFEFFYRPSVIKELFLTVVDREKWSDPSTSKFPFLCAEILSISIHLSSNGEERAQSVEQRAMDKMLEAICRELPNVVPELYEFLSTNENVVLPGDLLDHFGKVNDMLLQKFPSLMVRLLKNIPDMVKRIQTHLYSTVIQDLVHKLWLADDRFEILEQWNSDGWTLWLIGQFDPMRSIQDHQVALEIMEWMISLLNEKAGGEAGLDQLFCPQAISLYWSLLRLADRGTGEKFNNTSTAICILGVFEQLCSCPCARLVALVDSLEQDFDYFCAMLEPSKVVGMKRLKTVVFLSKLVHVPIRNDFVQKWIDRQVIIKILDMFFCHPWNNFLHSAVVTLVTNLLEKFENGPRNEYFDLARDMFINGNLLDRMIQASRDNELSVERPKGYRLGYMGHVHDITELVVRFCSRIENNSESKQVIETAIQQQSVLWKEHADRHEIQKQRQQQILGGGPKPLGESSGEHVYIGSDSSNELFSCSDQLTRFFCQQIVSNLPDHFVNLDIEDKPAGERRRRDPEPAGVLSTSDDQ